MTRGGRRCCLRVPIFCCTHWRDNSSPQSCWAGGWFGGFLSHAAALHGWGWVVGVSGIAFSVAHLRAISRPFWRTRQMFAAALSWTLASLAAAIAYEHGLRVPGTVAAALGALVMGWVVLSLEADAVDLQQMHRGEADDA